MAATDVGDGGAALELLDDAIERRKPRRDEIRVVPRAEEPLASFMHVVDMVVPTDAVPVARSLDDPRRVGDRAEGDLEEAGQVRGAVLVGERRSLLGRQGVAPAVGFVDDIAACSLRVEPLAHIALRSVRSTRELGRRERPRTRHCAVEAELVAHHDERGVQRRAHLVDCAEDEGHELVDVNRLLLDRCHISSPLDGVAARRTLRLPSFARLG